MGTPGNNALPSILWISLAQGAIVCFSALALSAQRIYHHRRQIELGDEYDIAMKKYEKRDPEVSFSDGKRVIRLLSDTSLLVLVSIYTVVILGSQKESQDDTDRSFIVHSLIASCIALICWLYCLVLCMTAYRFPLPDYWGWSLNIHLFIISFVMFGASIFDLVTTMYFGNFYSDGIPNLDLISRVCSAIFTFDLVYITGSANNGAPFVDENGRKTTVLNQSSIFGYFFFNWMTPIVKKVNKRQDQMTDSDLPSLAPSHLSYNLFYISERFRLQKRSVLYTVFFSCLGGFIGLSVVTIMASITRFVGPFLLNRFLNLIHDYHQNDGVKSDEQRLIGLGYIIAMSITIIVLNMLISQIWFFAQASIQIRVKAILSLEIFRKTLYLTDSSVAFKKEKNQKKEDEDSQKAKSKKENDDDTSNIGLIVNLISTDVNKIASFAYFAYILLEAPSEIIVGFYLLYYLLGWSSILSLMVLVITIPINYYISSIFVDTQGKLMKIGDKRLSLMNEVLQGIRQIKYFAWEKKWISRVMKSRNEEIAYLKKLWIVDIIFNFIWQSTPLFMVSVSFWSFTQIEGRELTASIAFTSIIVFNELQFSLVLIPETIIRFFETLVSLGRIQGYLDQQELENLPPVDPSSPVRIAFDNATIGWNTINPEMSITKVRSSSSSLSSTTTENLDVFKLHNLKLEFPNNQFSLVCGATGSGKTLLMQSLLGETAIFNGSVSCPRASIVTRLDDTNNTTSINLDSIPNHQDEITPQNWILNHSIAYVSQQPWLQNASIKDNILFGLPYLEKRYNETIFQCALRKDLDYLEDGDETEIGEKGITLSGGQKARVALARAVYSRAQNILMDNVLSAVDAHTANHIYQKCFLGRMMNSRTQILITHHVGLCISGCDYVVFLKDHGVEISGSPAELKRLGLLDSMVKAYDTHNNEEDEEDEEREMSTVESHINSGDTNRPTKKPKVLVEEEKRESGIVKFKHYQLYIKLAGGLLFLTLLLLSVAGARGLEIYSTAWIAKWTRSYESSSPPDTVDQTGYYVFIFFVINTSCILLFSGHTFVSAWGSLRASMTVYKQLLQHVFYAPLRFFDRTPVGRIVNRFSSDITVIDSEIPYDLTLFFRQTSNIISTVLVAVTVLPMALIPMVLVTIVNAYFGIQFSATSRELRRMNSITRSPMLTHFNETVNGIATIRAFGMTKQFLLSMIDKIDLNSRPSFYLFMVNRWIGIRSGITGALVCLSTGVFILWNLDNLDVATVGFCLSYILMFSDMSSWWIRRYTSLEMSFNSVERISEFLEMEQEAPSITDIRPLSDWPVRGAIQVKDLEVRYAYDLPLVLKGISFSVAAKEKVGIVGRTGSGKSTLSLSFFRFIEFSKGGITIDDVDISKIGLEDLRSKLTIIPQDPVLFSGTLRSNMDPFDQFSDADIYTSLRRVHLLTQEEIDQADGSSTSLIENGFRNPFIDLETAVHEGGNNFSQGQRQLLCLARALLKRSKVVLMDEATASVDFEIDRYIQNTIREEFSDSTVLCIAHRLNTVIDYDRIFVMEQGQIIEDASPYELLCNKDSAFYQMCRNSGEFDTLLSLAKEKHELVDTSS